LQAHSRRRVQQRVLTDMVISRFVPRSPGESLRPKSKL
jgi:hypothetical protein